MARRHAQAVAALVESLPPDDQLRLYEMLGDWRRRMDWRQRDEDETLDEVRSYRFSGGVHCPRCGSDDVYKWGKRRGKQRYRCKAEGCGRTFNDFTGTPFADTRQPWDRWSHYVECMLEGMTLRDCAQEVGITLRTSFRWRHVVLAALRQLDEDVELTGMIEADETYFLHSRKGDKNLVRRSRKRGGSAPVPGLSVFQDCVLTAQDREGNRYAAWIGQGKPKHKDVRDALAPRTSREATALCSDGEAAYAAFSQALGLQHHRCDHGQPADAPDAHLGNINNFHSLLKRWIRKFNGVASKYRDHYLSWFIFHREAREELTRTAAWRELLTRTALADPP